jgi:DNA-binding Xre family transcriptional regulator
MQIEFRLKAVLAENAQDHRGVIQEIAAATGIHRHTVARLYRGRAPSLSLDVLGKLCEWLGNHSVPRESLPGALLGARPSKLWEAIARPGEVSFYLGEYRIEQMVQVARWISRRDAVVANLIVEQLSDPTVVRKRPIFHTHYVPFFYDPRDTPGHRDIVAARKAFAQMRSPGMRRSSVLVGSSLVNHCVDLFVADLFGCEPFAPPAGGTPVPFYMGFRDRDSPSCFGGRKPPPGWTRPFVPGIYYREASGQWNVIEWRSKQQDAGIVITLYDAARQAVELVVFGFSGRGTAAMGEQLQRQPDRFWPTPAQRSIERQARIHICRIGFGGGGRGELDDDPGVEDFRVVREISIQAGRAAAGTPRGRRGGDVRTKSD